jgi:hypothetical protein
MFGSAASNGRSSALPSRAVERMLMVVAAFP